jgi:serine phosphatase RsbU (regulator of sigma subunit)
MLSPGAYVETIELQQKLARVQSLLEAARRVHATIELNDVLNCVLEIASKELEAEGAFFVSADEEIQSRSSYYGHLPVDWTRWTAENRLPGYAAAQLDNERGETFAHLAVYRPQPLSFEEQDFLEGIALQSALAVGNARHHEKALEWERVQKDLDAARAIQRSLLPQSPPPIAGYSLAMRSTTCYEVGGDYVDVMTLPGGKLMMVLADVAGKGLASALIGATFRSCFRAIAGTGLPLAEMAERINTLHYMEGEEARRRYVTAILLCLDSANHRVELVNAGHNPAFLTRGGGVAPLKIGASGPPLGMLPDRTYKSEIHELSAGTQLLLYTDGLTEVFQGDEEFGEDRLLGLLASAPSPDFLEYVWTTLTEFTRNARQTDDMTALYLVRAALGDNS